MALLAVEPESYFGKVRETILGDSEAANAYFELAQWQYGDYLGGSSFATWRPPHVDPLEMARFAEECAVRHGAYYAPQVIKGALGKEALPILRGMRPNVPERLQETVDDLIKQLEGKG